MMKANKKGKIVMMFAKINKFKSYKETFSVQGASKMELTHRKPKIS